MQLTETQLRIRNAVHDVTTGNITIEQLQRNAKAYSAGEIEALRELLAYYEREVTVSHPPRQTVAGNPYANSTAVRQRAGEASRRFNQMYVDILRACLKSVEESTATQEHQSILCLLGFHKWDGCKCSRCSRTKHAWNIDVCQKCGARQCGKCGEVIEPSLLNLLDRSDRLSQLGEHGTFLQAITKGTWRCPKCNGFNRCQHDLINPSWSRRL